MSSDETHPLSIERGRVDYTSVGFTRMLKGSMTRLTGTTTFRNPNYSTLEKLFPIVFYPLAIVRALIQPLIWLLLVTVSTPLAVFTPIISRGIAWIVYISILIGVIPPELFRTGLEWVLKYQDIVRKLIVELIKFV